MGACPGAINRISFKKETSPDWVSFNALHYTTLGNVKAKGVCGAGFIDAVAVMLHLGAIDETGAMTDEYAHNGFPAAEGIFITQADVRRFQLAKAAVFSGIKILCKAAGLESGGLDASYIAGGLGFYINLESAARTGLLPVEFAGGRKGKVRTEVCGNTSLKGAVKSLSDPDFLSRCKEIASLGTAIDLGLDRDFAETFTASMFF
jgi:uncharacterized 2Fe-2S/4Fe-4S cluster protein (DUF4445 family)